MTWYDNPTAPDLQADVIEEIDQLSVADGFVFIVDSRRFRNEASLEAFERLVGDLASRGATLDHVPVVFQVNWRDDADVCSMEWVKNSFRAPICAYAESIAPKGVGTTEALTLLLELIADRARTPETAPRTRR